MTTPSKPRRWWIHGTGYPDILATPVTEIKPFAECIEVVESSALDAAEREIERLRAEIKLLQKCLLQMQNAALDLTKQNAALRAEVAELKSLCAAFEEGSAEWEDEARVAKEENAALKAKLEKVIANNQKEHE